MVRTLFRSARRRAAAFVSSFAVLMLATASIASAETLMMPNRDTLIGPVNTVVWGVSDQANGTAYSIDFGDGSPVQNGVVADRSYIAFDHVYALANTYTATLTVGVEVATVQIRVYNPGSLLPEALRGVNINRAIEDALRYLWVTQTNRAGNFPAGTTTNWTGIAGYNGPSAGLNTLAFTNHGYKLPNNNNAPTGLYEKYIVRRGVNAVLALLEQATLGVQTAGNPCVGSGADCVGLVINQDSNVVGNFNFNHSSYETPFAAMVLAGAGAPTRTVTEVAGYVAGKTLSEILQRVANALVWGQQETNVSGRGGWYYALNYGAASDGSTVGWVILGLLDAEAAGAVLPAFVRTEWAAFALLNGINTNGSFDYQSDSSPASPSSPNVAKAGVGIQGMYFGGVPVGDVKVTNAITYIVDRWNNAALSQGFACGSSTYNKGCGYGMFNVFKGLRLYGINSIPTVGDWYRDYVDWLLLNQTSPTTQAGGQWAGAGANNLHFSSQTTNDPAEAALALLILSPVVLIQPDPDEFSSVGLRQGSPLSINPDTNPVNTLHTVTAFVESSGGSPIPGVSISFQVTGRNATTGSGTSDAAGRVDFQYTDTGAAGVGGQDSIRAFIGQVGSNLASNILIKNWVPAVSRCDADSDGDVDNTDLGIIRAANNTNASSAVDPRDGNGDGRINVADYRYCALRLTPVVQ